MVFRTYSAVRQAKEDWQASRDTWVLTVALILIHHLIRVNSSSLSCDWGFPGGTVIKTHVPVQETQETRFTPWIRKILWRRKWQPTPVFLLGNPMEGERSLVGCTPRSCKELGMTEWQHQPKLVTGSVFLVCRMRSRWSLRGLKFYHAWGRRGMEALSFVFNVPRYVMNLSLLLRHECCF